MAYTRQGKEDLSEYFLVWMDKFRIQIHSALVPKRCWCSNGVLCKINTQAATGMADRETWKEKKTRLNSEM